MKLAGKIIIAAAVVGGIAAGVVAALKTEKGKAITGKVTDAAKAGVGKAKDGIQSVKEKLTKKPGDVVAETTCEEIEEEIFEDELPEIAPEEMVTEEVAVDEEA